MKDYADTIMLYLIFLSLVFIAMYLSGIENSLFKIQLALEYHK